MHFYGMNTEGYFYINPNSPFPRELIAELEFRTAKKIHRLNE
jgi:hypothetical protein